jgi:hypothetical protein
MDIRGQGIVRDAETAHPALADQAKTQHHQQRQSQAVPAQLDASPTIAGVADLPAIGIMAHADEGHGVMIEQNLPGQTPERMEQAQDASDSLRPPGNIGEQQTEHSQAAYQ